MAVACRPESQEHGGRSAFGLGFFPRGRRPAAGRDLPFRLQPGQARHKPARTRGPLRARLGLRGRHPDASRHDSRNRRHNLDGTGRYTGSGSVFSTLRTPVICLFFIDMRFLDNGA